MDSKIFDTRLLFYGLDDFMINRNKIKEVFYTKNDMEQYLYKLFIYSQPFISETWKNNIWDFLRDDIEPGIFESEYTKMNGTKKI